MVRKKLAMAVLALSALHAGVVSALGVGNVSIRSTLNQPLNAEIRLLDIGELDATQIKVQLAPPEAFERAGVDRDFFLTNLRFNIELDGRGGGVVRITTREPVIEPYLNFIIEARWPNGRLLREYAVLLDPPTFSGGSASAPFVPAGESGLTTVQQQPQNRRLEPPRVSSEPAPARSSRADGVMPAAGPGQYRVQHNDTMSGIANRLRPSAEISTEQAMLAIQRANPDAFIRNNVNLVKSGYILRIPAAEEMSGLTATDAAQEVAAQNRAWRGGETYASGSSTATAPQLDARTPTTGDSGGFREQAQLSIAAPGDSAKSSAGEGAAGSGAGSAALRNELSSAQENLDSARRENSELQSRLDDMERQVATLQRLITLKDEQLAAMQNQAAASQDAAPAPEAVPDVDAGEPGESEFDAVAEAPIDSIADAGTETGAEATAPASAEPAPEPAASQPPPMASKPEPTLLEKLAENPLIPGGIGAALLLALGGVMIARRRKAAAEEEEALAALALDRSDDRSDTEEFSLDLPGSDSPIDDDTPIADTMPVAPVVAPVEERRQVRSETGDAIAESDIYIAYGRYQQAVDLLSSAIDAEPGRADLRLKLLEVYLEMRNREAFRRQYTELQALGDSTAVGRAKEMLSTVDGVSGWLDDLPQGGDGSGPAPVAAGLAAGAAGAAAFASAAEPVASGDNDELAFELELDELDDIGSGAADEAAEDHDFGDLDFITGGKPAVENPVWSEDEPQPLMDPSQATAFDLNLDLHDGPPSAAIGASPVFNDVSFAASPELMPEPTSEALPEQTPLAPAEDDMPLELDLAEGDLDLDLDFSTIDGEQGLQDLSAAFEPDQPAPPAPTTPVAFDLAHTDDFGDLDLDGELELKDDQQPLDRAGDLDLAAPVTPVDEALSGGESVAFDQAALDEAAFDEARLGSDHDTATFDLAEPTTPPPVFAEPVVTGGAGEADLGAADFDSELADLSDLELEMPAEQMPPPSPVGVDRGGFEPSSVESPSFEPSSFEPSGFDTGEPPATVSETPVFEEPGVDSFSEQRYEPTPDPFTQSQSQGAVEVPVLEAPEDDEFDFLADADEVATKLDLARAYIDMGDTDGARDILGEVMQEGTDVQKQEASSLLGRIG